ncbi:hypothetical protein Tsubulata_012582, partial [Turnera subulata]
FIPCETVKGEKKNPTPSLSLNYKHAYRILDQTNLTCPMRVSLASLWNWTHGRPQLLLAIYISRTIFGDNKLSHPDPAIVILNPESTGDAIILSGCPGGTTILWHVWVERNWDCNNSHSITSSSLPNFFPDTLLPLPLHFPSPSPFSSSSSTSPHHRRGTFSEWPGSSRRLRPVPRAAPPSPSRSSSQSLGSFFGGSSPLLLLLLTSSSSPLPSPTKLSLHYSTATYCSYCSRF